MTRSRFGPSVRSAVPPFEVMRVLAAANVRRHRGLPVYDFSAGQPSTQAPKAVRDAARHALDQDLLGYTAALGLPQLREAIAAHYRHAYDLDVPGTSVVVTTGSSGGLQLAFLAAFDPGDTVAVTRPGYPAVRNMLLALGCNVLDLTLSAGSVINQLQALPEPPAGLVLASPANPTGTMTSDTELAAIIGWCDENKVRFVSDEIYHGITFEHAAATAWQTSRTPIVLSSFSKYFSMTGWRLGWLLVPEDLLGAVDRLAGNFVICPPTLSQYGAVAAFADYAELEANVQRYRGNRNLLVSKLSAIGIDNLAPADGAFYIYADVSAFTNDSLAWAARLLDDCGVALAPGVDFDHMDGGRFVRLCFAGSYDDIETGVEILGDWLKQS